MKNKRIIDAMGNIDDELILGAERVTRKTKKPYLKWGAVAASFVLIAAAIVFVPKMLENGDDPLLPGGDMIENTSGSDETNALAQPDDTSNLTEDMTDDGASGKGNIFVLDSLNGRYGDADLFQGETGFMEWHWDDKTLSEKYFYMEFNGKEYTCRDSRKISSDLIDEHLCDGEAYGYEYDYGFSDEVIKHTKTVSVYKIKSVSADAIIAVDLDGEYYVYFSREVEMPKTLGEFFELVGFDKNVQLNKYSVYESRKKQGHYEIDGDFVMDILRECANAPVIGDVTSQIIDDGNYVSFTVTSKAIGVYKRAFYVSELGYVWTNIMEYAYAYNIGTSAAAKIIEYLKGDDAIECEMEPYMYYLCGIVTEIGDDYILLDDSVMCKNPEDGVVFKIDVSDPGVYRYVKYGYFEEGSVVQIAFWNRIEVGENNTVSGAISIWEGQLVDGDVIIEE